MGSQALGQAPRRRRRPEEAEGEILKAADELLRERPFHQVTVDEIMRRTTLSRKSFYVYFRDRYHLVTRLVAPLRETLDAANDRFIAGTGDPVADGRATLWAVASILRDDGALIRALAEAATYDAEARRVWRGFNEPVVAAFTDKFRKEIAGGPTPPLDVEPVVRALIGMNLYCFFDQVVGHPDADLERVVDTLHTVWVRVLLPERALDRG